MRNAKKKVKPKRNKKNKAKKNGWKKIILTSLIILGILALTGFVFISTGLVLLNNKGYNYKTHSYKGSWCDYTKEESTCISFPNMSINVKWNDDYMTSKPNELGEYERHVGYDSYVGSNAWITRRIYGKYYDENLEKECEWNRKWKYSAVPSEAILDGRTWYDESGNEIGRETGEDGMMLIMKIDNNICFKEGSTDYLP